MRVVVQNAPGHPDNLGFVVTHVGLNIDRQLADFRDVERDDKKFFEDLINGQLADDPPQDVLNGDARQTLRPEMVVNKEIVSEFFEEQFVTTDDTELLEHLRQQAEALGFDPSVIVAPPQNASTMRRVEASGAVPVVPQRQRQEARRRLNERVRHTAKVLLNRLAISFGGRDLAFKFGLRVTGNNFVAAVQLVNKELDRSLGWQPDSRNSMRTEDFQRGMDALSQVLDTLTRRLKAKEKEE
jgi:hypothetical protein